MPTISKVKPEKDKWDARLWECALNMAQFSHSFPSTAQYQNHVETNEMI